jgi:adenylylsulfate kinase-like enzyme
LNWGTRDMTDNAKPMVLVLMGVSGSGKSTIP